MNNYFLFIISSVSVVQLYVQQTCQVFVGVCLYYTVLAFTVLHCKKGLTIPVGISEVSNRRTNNTMVNKTGEKEHNDTQNTMQKTPRKTGCELGCSERVTSSCSTSDARYVILVTIHRQVMNQKRRILLPFVTQLFRNG